MGQPFLAEIRLISFNFPPKGWAFCNGQLLPINQNQALFALLGTNYGGDGRVNFALPNLQGRIPIGVGNGHTAGERGGEQAHTVSIAELPAHTHGLQATTAAAVAQTGPGAALATSGQDLYTNATELTALHPTSIPAVGGSQPHQNMQPYLTLNYCIALVGLFPSSTSD